MLTEESVVEFLTKKKQIEHQYRTVKRLERPTIKSLVNRDEIDGIYECKDFMSKRGIHMKEKSNPIAADG